MQTLIGFYVMPSAQKRSFNPKELGLFVESYFTQQGMGTQLPSFVALKPDIQKALVEQFGSTYRVYFYDPDLDEDADEFSARVILFVEADELPSTRFH